MGFILNPYRFSSGGGFDVETDITWHSLFYAEGTAFQALAYANNDEVTTWPNETGESDATGTNGPTFLTSGISGEPSLSFDSSNDWLSTSAFSSNPSYTSGVSIVVIADNPTANDNIFDGITSSNRNVLFVSVGSYAIFAGATRTGATVQGGADIFVAKFDGSTGNDVLRRNGGTTISSNAGSQTLTGLSIGGNYVPTLSALYQGKMALIGIYEGDIENDAAWGDFTDWATAKYSVAW